MRASIASKIDAERDKQDEQWGGPEHDDTHDMSDWRELIMNQLLRAQGESRTKQRERFVKVAALAVAALESIERKTTGAA